MTTVEGLKMEIYNDKYCVYIHTNKINGKKYVGQTSQKPEYRWKKDGRGYRSETYFGKAIQKYGWDNFGHEIIASNLTQEEAKNFEILLIDKLDTMNPDKGYNLTKGGEGTVGVVRSDEWREKQRQAQLGKNISEETRKLISENSARRRGPVFQYTKSKEFIKEWDCAETARRVTGINHINDVCRGDRKTAGGFIWKYAKEVS